MRHYLIATALIISNCFTLHAYAQNTNNESVSAIAFDDFVFHDSLTQYKLHYAFAGDVEKPGILFIHGTPGSWSAFDLYLNEPSLQHDYFMVSIDRIGWGGSSFEEPDVIEKNSRKPNSFSVQAESISAVMQRYPNKKWLLLGHSLGASIAPKVALINDKVKSLLLLAGSLEPKLGKPRWFNRFGNTLLIHWLLPKPLKYSNDEIMVLRDELKMLETELEKQKLDVDVVVMQGMKDKLVSPKNSKYIMQTWPTSFNSVREIELADANHFLPWQQTELVIKAIREFDY